MPTNEEVLQQILTILKPRVPNGAPEITAELDLVNDLGLDSLKVMEILENLEDTFDISIPINILPGIRTVEDLVVEIQKLTENEREWLFLINFNSWQKPARRWKKTAAIFLTSLWRTFLQLPRQL